MKTPTAFIKSIVFFLFLMAGINDIQAGKLPLRSEMSLNGTWNFTPEKGEKTFIQVPDFWDAAGFKNIRYAVYERRVTIPNMPEWKNKQIKLEFDAVNFIAEIYINNKLAGSHVGGFIPFSIDITKFVKPGDTFTLRVNVKGGSYPPIVDSEDNPQWPVGFVGHKVRWGIIFDVWLRAYGKVHIQDAFIQTSYRKKTIKVDYTVRNDDKKARTFTVVSSVSPAISPGDDILNFKSEELVIQPGQTVNISVQKQWENPMLWSPADPFLYYLKSNIAVSEDDKIEIIDTETRRFGFREVWIEGNKLMFNGHRFTIMGTNIVQHSEFHDTQRYYFMTPESWNASIDRLFELNLRTVRFHMQPAPEFIYDIADERGLLVMDESTIYAREYILKSNKEEYLKNCKKWIGPWITGHRNHPSIIVWSAENEMGVGWLNWMTSEEMKSLGDEIRKYDITRPVNYDGDEDVGDDMVNYHYIEGYKNTVDSSIYSWAEKVYPDKPTGVGEFITHYGERGNENQWWQGTWVRGMRYVNFSDIRPYRHDWAWLRNDNTEKIQNLINGLSPVALFDKAYDDLGIGPLLHKNYPTYHAGDTAKRTLVLYNDEFADTVITIEVILKSSQVYQAMYHYDGSRAPKQHIIANASKTYSVPLGERIEIECTFLVPALSEWYVDRFDMELIARKKGKVKFRETKCFSLRDMSFFTGKIPDKGRSSEIEIKLSEGMLQGY